MPSTSCYVIFSIFVTNFTAYHFATGYPVVRYPKNSSNYPTFNDLQPLASSHHSLSLTYEPLAPSLEPFTPSYGPLLQSYEPYAPPHEPLAQSNKPPAPTFDPFGPPLLNHPDGRDVLTPPNLTSPKAHLPPVEEEIPDVPLFQAWDYFVNGTMDVLKGTMFPVGPVKKILKFFDKATTPAPRPNLEELLKARSSNEQPEQTLLEWILGVDSRDSNREATAIEKFLGLGPRPLITHGYYKAGTIEGFIYEAIRRQVPFFEFFFPTDLDRYASRDPWDWKALLRRLY